MRYENNLFINEEAFFNKQFKNPVYIVLMHSGTPLANVIKKATGDEFSHACISFNSRLDPLYSFGSKGEGERGTGFAVNKPTDKFFDKFAAKYSVYVMYVTDKAYKSMQNRLQYFVQNKDKLKYDLKGLIDIWFGNDSEDHEKWFCSRFVMEIISKAQNLTKVPSLWKPNDITQLDNISLVNRGFNFYNYDYRLTEKHCSEIKHHTYNVSDVLYEGISISAAGDMGSKKTDSLSQYSRMTLSDAAVRVYSGEYPRLRHIRITNKTKGFIWTEGSDVVAIVNVEEKDDDTKWIQALEVFGKCKGKGLSKQVLDVAVKQLGATRLSVAKNNDIALHVYKSYGFKIDKTTDSMYFMVIKSSYQEAGDTVKYYANPSQQLKAKKTKKHNDQIKLGDYTDVGAYKMSSFDAGSSNTNSASTDNSGGQSQSEAGNVEDKEFDEAVKKAQELLCKSIRECRDHCECYEIVNLPYNGSVAIARYKHGEIDNQESFERDRDAVVKYAGKIFGDIRPGYIMDCDDDCIFISKQH